MRTLFPVLSCLATGCVWAEPEGVVGGSPSWTAPEVLLAEADCVPDKHGAAWAFEAWVVDPDGAEDVIFVHLDVVDRVGLVDSVPLLRAPDEPELWTALVPGGDTPLACEGSYDLIFRAVDRAGDETFLQRAYRSDVQGSTTAR